MITRSLIRLASIVGVVSVFSGAFVSAAVPIRVHPQNPYILEFRGKPTLLKTYAAGYDCLYDTSMDYIPYFDVLARDGMNLVRVWCCSMPTLRPANLLQPWPRSRAAGNARDGLGKWDLSAWDEAYFARIKAFAQAASDRGIVVEYTFFSVFYEDDNWQGSPLHPSNNVQGYGPNNRFDCLRPVDSNLFAAQKAAVRRIVRELNAFDNVYFEIINEPFWNEPNAKDITFHNTLLAEIRAEEAGLPNKHLVAHNFPQQMSSMSSGFDIINEHYPIPVPGATIAGGEALLSNQYNRGKVLALDETNPVSEPQTRLESWMFLIGGGGVYSAKDDAELVYKPSNRAGDNSLGRSIRASVKNAGAYMEQFELVNLRRNLSWVTGGIPSGATLQASANAGSEYVAYLHHGKKSSSNNFQLYYDPIDSGNHSVSLRVSLDSGSWRAIWTRPADMVILRTQEFTHTGGNVTLQSVAYQADVALRIERVDAPLSVTAPSKPTGFHVVE